MQVALQNETPKLRAIGSAFLASFIHIGLQT
jgi:hypothetical protein